MTGVMDILNTATLVQEVEAEEFLHASRKLLVEKGGRIYNYPCISRRMDASLKMGQ